MRPLLLLLCESLKRSAFEVPYRVNDDTTKADKG
jgi:hypothetical protein